VKSFAVRLNFHGGLQFFLGSKTPGTPIERNLREKASVKDVIESCGVPHPEVDLILVDGEPVDFAFCIVGDAKIEVYPAGVRYPSFADKRLQTIGITSFVADGHLGKLVRDLRLLGLDVLYDPTTDDRELVRISTEQNRGLLTRDRRLLMHAAIRHGYYVRSQKPLEQTIEVLRRFSLESELSPFSRCLLCNASLESIEKKQVISQLEPLTKIYYNEFRRCTACRQVYWPGSHFDKLRKRVEAIQSHFGDA
jgi:uncharacterized protein